MIAPLNYAAQAVRDLRGPIAGRNLDKELVLSLSTMIEEAQHFQLPDGGRILDDGLKGLRGESLRLPYPSITVEYRVPVEMHQLTPKSPQVCTKRIAMAVQVKEDELSEILPRILPNERHTFVRGGINIVAVDEIGSCWVPMSVGVLVPSVWYNGEYEGGEAKIFGYPYTFLPQWYGLVIRKNASFGVQEAEVREGMVHDVWDEVCAVLALLEALTCTNVKSESIQRSDTKVNFRRARDGKLPLYEVKVLTIDAPARIARSDWQAGHHASPRQHLRRGHIRNRNGNKFWVNSHLVGDPKKGKIVKTYDVRTV